MADYNVTVSLGGVGATATSGVYNVLDYGAAKDGTTDDTTAIQAACTACASAGSGTVLFPAGTYAVSTGSITVGSGVSISGYGATISTDSGIILFTLAGSNKISGLTFDGNDDTSANAANNMILGLDTSDIEIRDCDFVDVANSSIVLNGVTEIRIIDCTFTDSRQADGIAGIKISDGTSYRESENIHIRGCRFVQNSQASNGSGGIILQGADETGSGLGPYYVKNITIDSCHFLGTGRNSSGYRGDIDVYNDVDGLIVRGCTSYGGLYSFVKAEDVKNVLIEGNIVDDNEAYGVVIADRYGNTINHDITIRGNIFKDITLRAIDVATSDTDTADYIYRINISDNTINTTGNDGIRLQNATQSVVSGNIVYGTAQEGIYVANGSATDDPALTVVNNIVNMLAVSDDGILFNPRANNPGCVISGNQVIGGSPAFTVSNNPGRKIISTYTNQYVPSAEPSAPVEGMVYYDSTADKLKVYTGAAWEAITSA